MNKVLRNQELSAAYAAAQTSRDNSRTCFRRRNVSCDSCRSEMEIQFVSSLTADDENRIAPGLLELLCAILDQLPVAYTLRIRTGTGQTLQRKQSEPLRAVVSPDR
jgi:hypothetical protein